MRKLIGRSRELAELRECYDSEHAEFVIVYGRRRIGKTFLVRQFFKDNFAFNYVGGHKLTKQEQLSGFAKALEKYTGAFAPKLSNWFDAFDCLQQYLENQKTQERQVIFIDEMPWIDTQKSEFVKALENFWNGWAAMQDNILFIACGSSTSWMVDKLIMNQGGLHNRITRSIYLRPFTLGETREFLHSQRITWDDYQIVQTYMTMGGVPFYLEMLRPSLSLAQNIDELFFSKNGRLRNEYDELYSALFPNAEKYIQIMETLSKRKEGMTRNELMASTKTTGGLLTKMLKNLERCDFILSYAHYGHRQKETRFRICDFYTLFYYKFVVNDLSKDEAKWTHSLNTPTVNSWQGFAFELVCLSHLNEIKRALGISGIATSASCWRDSSHQIDLLIERADRIINVCEIKFSQGTYSISPDYAMQIRERLEAFRETVKTRLSLQSTFITTFGVKPASSVAETEITLKQLF